MVPYVVVAKAEQTKVTRRGRYHHGNLRAALIEATEQLIEEGGPESVTVREAARRAGVSSGAPFRHFPNRTALMTAVAEQGMSRLVAEVERALQRTAAADPLTRATAFGEAYFRWVLRNPTQFRVISARNLIDFESSKTLTRDNDVLRAAMTHVLEEGRRVGLFHYRDVGRVQLATRAVVYGVARMYADGHFAQWDVPARGARLAMRDVFALFLDGLAHGRRRASPRRR